MSYSRTPPPPETLQAVEVATYMLYGAMSFTRKTWQGGVIGAFGTVALSFFTLGSGELLLFDFFDLAAKAPYRFLSGFVLGALFSLVGQIIRKYFFEFLKAEARGKLSDWEG